MTEPDVTLKLCAGLSPANDPEVQRVSSQRYNHRTWMISKLEGHEDRWALFDDSRTLIAIGPWDSIRTLYNPQKRINPQPLPKLPTDLGIDLKGLGL